MGVWDQIPLYQSLSLLKRHKRASAVAATALLAILLPLLPHGILSFMLGMIASPILIAIAVVSPQDSRLGLMVKSLSGQPRVMTISELC